MAFPSHASDRAIQGRVRPWILASFIGLAVTLLPALAGAQSATTIQRMKVALVVIRPYGFEPGEMTHSAGRVLLVVYNRSGLKHITLRLDREAGNRLREVNVPREKRDWRELVDLTPGNYLLTEANHPKWACRITITSSQN